MIPENTIAYQPEFRIVLGEFVASKFFFRRFALLIGHHDLTSLLEQAYKVPAKLKSVHICKVSQHNWFGQKKKKKRLEARRS